MNLWIVTLCLVMTSVAMANNMYNDPEVNAKKLVAAYESALLKTDYLKIASLYVNDCKMVTSRDNFLSGADAVGAYMKNLFTGFSVGEVDITVADLQSLSGGLHMLYGAYRFDMISKSSDQQVVFEGKYTILAQEDTEGLKIIQHTAFVPEAPVDIAGRYAALANEYEELLEQEDISGIVQLHTQDGQLMGSNGRILSGHDQITAYYKQLLGAVEMQEVTVDIHQVSPLTADLFYASGSYQFDVIPSGTSETNAIKGRYTMVVKDLGTKLRVEKMVAMRPVTNPMAAN